MLVLVMDAESSVETNFEARSTQAHPDIANEDPVTALNSVKCHSLIQGNFKVHCHIKPI